MNAPFNQPVPMLDPDVLRTFVAIADTGSFSAAAATVYRTPSAVSMQIKKLEDMLGRPVLSRDARSVTLTSDGAILLGYARRLLSLNREAVSQFITPDITGVVRLGAPDDVSDSMLPGILKRFATSHPSIVVDVVIDQSMRLLKAVDEKRLDITLINCSNDRDPPGCEILITEPLVWAGAKGGCAHLRKPIPVSMWEEGCAWRAEAVKALDARSIEYRVAYMSAHMTGQRAAIKSDLAVSPLPRAFVGDDLVALGEDDGMPTMGSYRLGMIIAAGAEAPAHAAADHIRAAFQSYEETGVFLD